MDELAPRLWPLAVAAAAKGKLLPPADAEAELRAAGDTALDALDQACALLQRWCWARGMPPIDRVIAHPRVQGAVREVADYDVFFEAMGVVVTGERFVLAYPWRKVREPTARELAWAAAFTPAQSRLVRAFRFLDLELELLDRDAARGRRRPVPPGSPSWDDVASRRAALLAELAHHAIRGADLRPPGQAPYPPPLPRESSYEH